MKKIQKVFSWFVGFLGIVLLVVGFYLQWTGFEALLQMRQMERIPKTSIDQVIGGEVNVQGKAEVGEKLVTGRFSKAPCYYCHYVVEEEVQTDNGRGWDEVESGSYSADFQLVDETGIILVELSRGGVVPELKKDWETIGKKKGSSRDYRFSEYRIDKGERLSVFAMAKKREGGFSLRFDEEGSFTPVLSNDDELENRTDLGTKGVFLIVGGLALLSLICYMGCVAFRIHRVLVFLGIGSAFNFAALFISGMIMMKMDLQDGFNRLKRMEKTATVEVSELMGGQFDWRTLPSQIGLLKKKNSKRILGIREDYLASIERTNAIRERFPERWLAPLWGIDPWPSLLGEGESVSHEAAIAKTPINPILSFFGLQVAGLMMGFGSFLGFRRTKIKRYVENVPTSLSAGLAYGPAEIKGRVEFKGGLALDAPISSKKCVYYHYRITEERGSGQNKKIVVIKDEKKFVPFHCRDAEGVTEINLTGAEITGISSISKTIGGQSHEESYISNEMEVYALGTAVLDEETGDHLVLSRGDFNNFPFLFSGHSETEVMLRQSWGGLLGISLAQNGSMFLGLFTFGYLGSFAATDFLLSAFVPPLFLVLFMFALMFNDLVFLRNRVKRAWANIEVSLKKRADLIPSLEKIVQAYLSHEKSVLDTVSRFRSSVVGKNSFSPAEVDAAMMEETALASRLIALQENYPDLKGNQMMEDFMRRLTRMENEVALMRAGYNDGIERYHEAKKRIPEVFLAKLFKFQDAEFLRFSMESGKFPP